MFIIVYVVIDSVIYLVYGGTTILILKQQLQWPKQESSLPATSVKVSVSVRKKRKLTMNITYFIEKKRMKKYTTKTTIVLDLFLFSL